MKTNSSLEQLHILLGSYIDLELENFILSTQLLEQGLSLNQVQPFTKAPKLINLLRTNYQLDHNQIQYFSSFKLNPLSANGLYQIRENKLFLFHDDLWEITISHPTQYQITSYFTGEYLLDILRQGLNGVIPKMIKERTSLSIKHEKFTGVLFNLQAKLCLEHPHYSKSFRAQTLSQINFATSESEVLKSLKPVDLFRRISGPSMNSKKRKFDIVQERLKLWGRERSFPWHNASEEELNNFFNQLPSLDFGIKDLGLLRQVINHFHNPISNEVLLTGEMGGDVFNYRKTIDFNNHLKSLLK